MTNDAPISQPGWDIPTTELLAEMERLLRALNIRTLDPTAIPYPQDVYTLLGDWNAVLSRIPQGLTQLAAALAEHSRTHTLATDATTPQAPLPVIHDTSRFLDASAGHLEQAAKSVQLGSVWLRKAHVLIGCVTVLDDGRTTETDEATETDETGEATENTESEDTTETD